jgi:hypothetical protein
MHLARIDHEGSHVERGGIGLRGQPARRRNGIANTRRVARKVIDTGAGNRTVNVHDNDLGRRR